VDNRIYKAPSIPKINRTTIASPFTRGGVSSSGIRLKRSSFSFIRPIKRQIDPEKLAQPAAEQTNFIGKELAETNRVLVEIQKQLSLDFGYRIAEEKKAIALEKKRISRRRVSDKESRLEKGPKGVLGRTFDAVTAPFKSIFQKLIDFFSIILTGILMNTAFEWLGKKENQAKVKAFFDFVTEYWKELLIIFAAYKLLKLVKAIAGVATTLRRMLKWFKGFAVPKGPKPSITTPTPPPINPSSLSRSNSSYAKFIQGQSNIGDRLRLLRRGNIGLSGLFTKGGFNEAGQLRGQGLKLPKLPQLPKFQVPGGANLPQLPKGINLGNLLRILAALEGIRRFKEGDITGGTLSFGSMMPIAGLPIFGIDLLRSMVGKDYFDKTYGQALSGEIGLSDAEIEKRMKGSAFRNALITPSLFGGMSQGGTVGQGDRAGTDTVPAQSGFGKMFLDAGEEVIRTSSAMLFRPLLKDINENAGRMWQQFSQAVIKLMDITGIQKDNAEIFKQVLENYNKFLKDQVQKLKLKELENVGGGMGGGTGGMPSSYATSTPMSSPVPTLQNINLNLSKEEDNPQENLPPSIINASISAPQTSSAKLTPVTPTVNNFILNSSSNKSTFTEINLPPQVINNTPKVPTYSGKSNEVPNIIPFDFLNPWMTKQSISERYGVAYGI